MQLGTRWTSGDEPPRAVPEVLHPQIQAVDRTIPAPPPGGYLPRWTLTWLEGRPIAELDTGVIVELDGTGAVVVRHDEDDEFA